MSRLEPLQNALAQSLMGDGAAHVVPALAPTPITAAGGLGIYRNHFLITLEDALAATFPAIRRLVGSGYFAQAARRYVRLSPPDSPCLFEYGAAFPDFLDELPEARDLPYLGDVARLEWAINLASHAPDSPTLGLDRLQRIVSERPWDCGVEMHPSLRLLTSPYPITAIWRAAQPESDPDLRVDLGQGGENVLILRLGHDATFRRLTDDEYRFLNALSEGATVLRASLEAGQPVGRYVGLLSALVRAGAFSDAVPTTSSTRE